MANELFFKTNSKIEKILGRELISNNSIAIFELIKNSYDAGAQNVHIRFKNFKTNNKKNKNDIISTPDSVIEVEDDGRGMSFIEVQDIWMELGTPAKNINKKQNVRIRKNQIELILERVVNGDKGIGRLGVDKIGSKLLLKASSSEETTKVEFDWNKFDDYSKQIDQIPCPYELLNNEQQKTGLFLQISSLRNSWTYRDIMRIKDNLKKFLSPIRNKDDIFNIYFEIKYENSLNFDFVESIRNDTFDYLESYIDATINSNGALLYKIKYADEEIFESSKNLKIPTFGATRIKIFFLNKGQKQVFTRKMGIKPNQYGSIKIFKDNFQIFPYGEPQNDWLGIDSEHSKGFFRTFSTQNLIGHVLLDDDNNLLQLSSRVGLVEDCEEFSDLKNVIWEILDIFKDYIFTILKRTSKETSQIVHDEINELNTTTNDLIDNFYRIIDEIPIDESDKQSIKDDFKENKDDLDKHLKALRNASEEIDKKLKIYDQITSKESFFLSIIHTIKNKIGFLRIDIDYIDRKLKKNKIDFDMDVTKRTFSSIDHLINATLDNLKFSDQDAVSLDIDVLLDKFLKSIEKVAKNENINIYTKFNERIIVKANIDGLICVLENLFDNSVKALKNIEEKSIWIDIVLTKKYCNILFKDNGIGIPEEKKPFIFSLWSSHNENVVGTGMGLPTCKNLLEQYSGDIALIEDVNTLFRIRLPLFEG